MGQPIDIDAYRANGFVVLPSLFTAAEMAALSREVTRLCRGAYGAIEGLEATRPDEPEADLLRRYMACHVVHKALPLTRTMLADRRIVDVVSAPIGPNVKCLHSVLFLKAPGEPGNAWHQDETFIPTRDRSLTTVWIAIDDAEIANGCLRFLPGSHASGILWPMRPHNDPELDRAEIAFGFPHAEDDAGVVEIASGSAVMFNGYTLHGSFPNRTLDRFRRSVQFVYMRAESLLPWDQVGRAPTGEDYRDVIMVSGTDPYAYKGIADLGVAYMRKPGPTPADQRAAAAHRHLTDRTVAPG